MADLTVTAANVLAGANAKKRTGVAGATVEAGQPVYEDATDSYSLKLADADALASSKCAGIALHGAADGQPLTFVEEDDDFTPGATLTTGTTYCVSTTAGGIAPQADLASGDYVTVLMVAKSTTKAKLKIIRTEAAI